MTPVWPESAFLARRILERKVIAVGIEKPGDPGAAWGGPEATVVLLHAVAAGEVHPLGNQFVDRAVGVVDLPAEHGARRSVHGVDGGDPQLRGAGVGDQRERAGVLEVKPKHPAVGKLHGMQITDVDKASDSCILRVMASP